MRERCSSIECETVDVVARTAARPRAAALRYRANSHICRGGRRESGPMVPRSGHIRMSQSSRVVVNTRTKRIATGVIMSAIKPGKPVDLDEPTAHEVEGEIREFVRRDVATLRRHPEADSEVVASNIGSLLQRVAGTSVQEVDRLIAELQALRELLHMEGARVQR